MPIPSYEEIMLPLLKYVEDGQEHSTREVIPALVDEFNLSEDERKELLPSGKQTVFHNRVGWAKTYMQKACLLESPKRGFFKITERGLWVLSQSPKKITNNFLTQFPEFVKFKSSNQETTEPESEIENLVDSNPECLFTSKSFDLLMEWHNNPTLDFQFQHENELTKQVKEPFDTLLALVSSLPPDQLTTPVGTTQWNGTCLEGYFSQFGFLFIQISYTGLEFGFRVTSKYSALLGDYQERFHRNYKKNQEVLASIIPNSTLTILIHKTEVLQSFAQQLSEQIAETFKKLYPIIFLATLDEPMPAIREYLNSQNIKNAIKSYSLINEAYTLDECVQETGFSELELKRCFKAIDRKKQAILYGSPGTGKTYIAEHLTKYMLSGTDGFSELVQFHPAYSYEDFIQGIRPQSKDGDLKYSLVPGRFLEFCKKAESCEGLCVLIIDEINRANLANVFGELMYLLEYRDKKIRLAGSSEPFSIPENVRIIGTMNTADRSIALVDHALRRRFAFIEIRPNYDVLRRYHEKKKTGFQVEGLIKTLERLNKAIADKHYEVGISYFLTENLAEELEDIWQMEIEPYLEEYFYDQLDKVDKFCWNKIKQQVCP